MNIKLAAALMSCAAFLSSANLSRGDAESAAEWARTPFNFSGFYAGFNIGGMLANYDRRGHDQDGGFFDVLDVEEQFFEGEFGGGPKSRPSIVDGGGMDDFDGIAEFFIAGHSDSDGSVIGGGQTGYRYQFGHVVIGIEGSALRTSTGMARTDRDFASTLLFEGADRPSIEQPLPIDSITFGDTNLTVTRSIQMDWTASALGTLGWGQGPFLFYAIGGPTWAGITTRGTDVASTDFFEQLIFTERPNGGPPPLLPEFLGNNTTSVHSSHSDTRFGWTAGGGIEIAFARQISMALEYRHSDFGDETDGFSNHGTPLFPGSTNFDVVTDQVTLKFNVLFNNFFGH